MPPQITFEQAKFITMLMNEGEMRDLKVLPGDRWAATKRFLFTHAILVGRMGDEIGYDDRWCYKTHEAAKAALEAWDGTGEPKGWHRHPATGRRVSEDGMEYVSL